MRSLVFMLSVLAGMEVSYSQSVSVNTDGSVPAPSAILDIKSTTKGMLVPRMTTSQRTAITTPAKGLLVFDTDSNSFWFHNGTAWTNLSAAGGGVGWIANGNDISNTNTGNIGIGVTAPQAPLHIRKNGEAVRVEGNASLIDFYNNGGTAPRAFIQSTNNDMLIGTSTGNTTGNTYVFSNGTPLLTATPAGNIGIGVTAPVNKLQIGTTPTVTGFLFAAGNGTDAIGLNVLPTSSYFNSTKSISMLPGNGYTGINTLNPVNRLQIGSLGQAGFNGNDLAIGNGTNAMAFFQNNNASLLASTTNIALLPVFGGIGRVGINTTTARAPLDVVGTAAPAPLTAFYYYLAGGGELEIHSQTSSGPINNISIIASGNVYAREFDAYSDARIKDIRGTSNARNDLAVINQLKITDYSMKDKVTYGNKTFKKVIAQEVEKVYPKVISKHRDFIPNVYQPVVAITKTIDGYLLRFKTAHHISADAKKLQVLLDDKKGMQQVEIVATPNAHEVIIQLDELTTDKAFVYGEEVADFRTVDYEGLTTLNISATQEIYRQLQNERNINKAQEKRIAALEDSIELLKNRSAVKRSSN